MRPMRPTTPEKRFQDLASSLVKAATARRLEALPRALSDIKGKFNHNGALGSTACVNSLFGRCAEELRAMGAENYDAIKHARPPIGMASGQVIELLLLEHQRDEIFALQEQATLPVESHLSNASMIDRDAVRNTHRALLNEYEPEIELFIAEQKERAQWWRHPGKIVARLVALGSKFISH